MGWQIFLSMALELLQAAAYISLSTASVFQSQSGIGIQPCRRWLLM
jgi:hypothetical protein